MLRGGYVLTLPEPSSTLYFARSWTGELVLRAAIAFKEKEAVLTEVEASRAKVMGDPALAVRMVEPAPGGRHTAFGPAPL